MSEDKKGKKDNPEIGWPAMIGFGIVTFLSKTRKLDGTTVMIIIGAIVIIYGIIWYIKNNNPVEEGIRELCEGKTENQRKVIEYFCRPQGGCLSKDTISDEEYSQMVAARRDSFAFRARALEKIGIDTTQVNEIPPVTFEGYVFNNALAKQRVDGAWTSSAYQVSWLFFSSTQVYVYRCTFNMDNDKKQESTDEFFYRDVTSFSTSSETEVAHGLGENKFEIETNKFKMVVPGDKLLISMGVNTENIIGAMKQKLREKKMC